MLRSCLPESQRTDLHFTLDGDSYKVSWSKSGAQQRPDLSNLPPFERASYLVNTVKFHLGGLFRLFDEKEFLQHMNEFYSNAAEKIRTHRLWYTQYLLIMAFGTGLLNVSTSPGVLAGSNYFCRAMSVLPELPALHEEPVMAIEVLSLTALYFYCLDMRQTAYSYVSDDEAVYYKSADTYLHRLVKLFVWLLWKETIQISGAVN